VSGRWRVERRNDGLWLVAPNGQAMASGGIEELQEIQSILNHDLDAGGPGAKRLLDDLGQPVSANPDFPEDRL
jgi:hypothetical protein